MGKWEEWKREFRDHKNSISLAIIFLIVAIILTYFAGIYVDKVNKIAVPDLILNNIPTLDLDVIFIYGIIIIITVLLAYPLFFKIRELHRVISHLSLLLMVRAAFTCFTHLKTPLDAYVFQPPHLLSFMYFNSDLFFSGHTAIPFLGFLLFKGHKIRYFFLVASIIMALTVLFMHIHYTIDVLSAFFITYGTYKIGERFFRKIKD